MIVVVGNEKGGTGKTTTAANLAVMRAHAGKDVLLVDADPQESLTQFALLRSIENLTPTFTSVKITGKGLAAEVRNLAPKYDDVIIDCGGRDTAGLRSALLVADKVVIPFLASQLDLWAIETFDEIIGNAQAINPNLIARLLVNKQDTNRAIKLADEAIEIATDLKNITLMPMSLGYRVAYRRAIGEGRGVIEMPKKDAKAVAEIESLYKEVFSA